MQETKPSIKHAIEAQVTQCSKKDAGFRVRTNTLLLFLQGWEVHRLRVLFGQTIHLRAHEEVASTYFAVPDLSKVTPASNPALHLLRGIAIGMFLQCWTDSDGTTTKNEASTGAVHAHRHEAIS